MESANENQESLFTADIPVVPVLEQDGAVRTWTLMSSEGGDFEWARAVREVAIEPNTTWSPPPDSAEKGAVVVKGRGTITVDGQRAEIFHEDIVAVPSNMPFSIETTGHSPIYILVSEAYADVKSSELADLEPGVKWTEPWLQINAQTARTQDEARSALDTASGAMETGSGLIITRLKSCIM